MMRALIAFTVLAALAQGPAATGLAWSRVAATHRQRVEQVGIVGSSLLFVADGQVAHTSSVGYQDLASQRAADGEGGSGTDVQAGLSSFVERHGGVEPVGHSGDQNGFISHLYLHRPSRSGYIIAFTTNVTSVRDPRHTTRAVDDDIREAIVREFWASR